LNIDETGFCEDEGLLQTLSSCLSGLHIDAMKESVDLVPDAHLRGEVKKLKKRVKESIADVAELHSFILNLNSGQKEPIAAQISVVSAILRRHVASLSVAPQKVLTKADKDIKADLELLSVEIQRMRDVVERRKRCRSHSHLFQEIEAARSRVQFSSLGKPSLPRRSKMLSINMTSRSNLLKGSRPSLMTGKVQGSRRKLVASPEAAGPAGSTPQSLLSSRQNFSERTALNTTMDDHQDNHPASAYVRGPLIFFREPPSSRIVNHARVM
jgi:hypothetical protein